MWLLCCVLVFSGLLRVAGAWGSVSVNNKQQTLFTPSLSELQHSAHVNTRLMFANSTVFWVENTESRARQLI